MLKRKSRKDFDLFRENHHRLKVILSRSFENAPLSPLWNGVYNGGKLPLRVKKLRE